MMTITEETRDAHNRDVNKQIEHELKIVELVHSTRQTFLVVEQDREY